MRNFMNFGFSTNLFLMDKVASHIPAATQCAASDVVQLLKEWRKNDEDELYSLVEISCALHEILCTRKHKGRDKFISLALIIYFLVVIITFSLLFIFLENLSDKYRDLLSVNDRLRNRMERLGKKSTYIEISKLFDFDFSNAESLNYLTLQWGNSGATNARKYYFTIKSAIRDGTENSTTFRLSSGYKLVALPSKAILYDIDNKEVGYVVYKKSEFETNDATTVELFEGANNMTTNNYIKRSLSYLRKGTKHNEVDIIDQPISAFDAYCRYGCGAMSVTFPYYYRPFFGYGYPLVGMDAMFPAGYGGYAAAPILANQAARSMPFTIGNTGVIPPLITRSFGA